MNSSTQRHSIDWELMEIIPGPYNLFDHLDRWFDEPRTTTLQRLYKHTTEVNPEFGRRMQQRQRVLDKKENTRWRRHTQRRLLAVQAAMRGLADRLWDRTEIDSWQMRNCQPAGGAWKPHYPAGFKSGITGKRCGCRACPWCYLRTWVFLRDLVRSAGAIDHPKRKRASEGFGFGSVVSCAIYERFEAETVFTEAGSSKFRDEVDEAFRKCEVKPPRALKLLAPVYKDGNLGLRISYLYSGEYDLEIYKTHGERDTSMSYPKQPVDRVMMRCYPYIPKLLDESVDPRVVKDLIRGLDKKKSFSSVSFSSSTAH